MWYIVFYSEVVYHLMFLMLFYVMDLLVWQRSTVVRGDDAYCFTGILGENKNQNWQQLHGVWFGRNARLLSFVFRMMWSIVARVWGSTMLLRRRRLSGEGRTKSRREWKCHNMRGQFADYSGTASKCSSSSSSLSSSSSIWLLWPK